MCRRRHRRDAERRASDRRPQRQPRRSSSRSTPSLSMTDGPAKRSRPHTWPTVDDLDDAAAVSIDGHGRAALLDFDRRKANGFDMTMPRGAPTATSNCEAARSAAGSDANVVDAPRAAAATPHRRRTVVSTATNSLVHGTATVAYYPDQDVRSIASLCVAGRMPAAFGGARMSSPAPARRASRSRPVARRGSRGQRIRHSRRLLPITGHRTARDWRPSEPPFATDGQLTRHEDNCRDPRRKPEC